MRVSPDRRSLLYFCLFLSGAAGLLYEVLWVRILGLSFGHTVYAVTTVLAAFMGGLALGSWLLGRVADRLPSPLLFYAFLEIAIGIYCLITPFLLSRVRDIYLGSYPYLPGSPLLKAPVQFLLVFPVLLIPTTLMGGTLPAVVRGLVKDRDQAGRKVAFLYGTNTLGAVLGALAAGYWLLPAAGVRATNGLGVAANLLAGLAVLVLVRRTVEQDPAGAREVAAVPVALRREKVLLGCFALSGAVGMTYQLVWTRALVLVIGSSTYAFTAILVTFLGGIALGSYLFPMVRGGERYNVFALLQIAIAVSAMVLAIYFERLPGIFLSLLGGSDWSHGSVVMIQFAVVSAVVIIPTALMGMTFPCVTGILAGRVDRLGSDVGRYYAFNTLGAIAGTVLTGFVLIPLLGSLRSLSLGIGANLLAAGAVLITTCPQWRKQLTAGLAAVVVLLALLPAWSTKVMHSGVAVYPGTYLGLEGRDVIEERFKGIEFPFTREGISTTVALVVDGEGNRALLVNGKTDASSSHEDLRTMSMTAFVPMVLHPEPRRVAIIGLGSGVTAGVASLFRSTETIDVVELEPAVAQAARYFEEENFGILDDVRLKLVFEDGRSFVQGTAATYDILISQPSNPWISGVSSLFTKEFMEEARERLAPGGAFCLWVQGYRITPEDLKMVLRTFQEVYPDAVLWQGSLFDYILVGWKGTPRTVTTDEILARIARNPGLGNVPGLEGKLVPDGLMDSFLLGPGGIEAYTGDGVINTDDRDILGFSAPRSLYRSSGLKIDEGIWRARISNYPPFVLP